MVEALPPPRVLQDEKPSISPYTHEPSTPYKPTHTPSSSLGSRRFSFEESGSGEPSGDDDMEGSGVEASGDEPLGNADHSIHSPYSFSRKGFRHNCEELMTREDEILLYVD